jgi:hypothetical protein
VIDRNQLSHGLTSRLVAFAVRDVAQLTLQPFVVCISCTLFCRAVGLLPAAVVQLCKDASIPGNVGSLACYAVHVFRRHQVVKPVAVLGFCIWVGSPKFRVRNKHFVGRHLLATTAIFIDTYSNLLRFISFSNALIFAFFVSLLS